MGGTKISAEAKQREVLQLLKDYRPWHSAFGGAMPLDETHVVDAAYGPAGMVEAGQAFSKEDRPKLVKSYKKLGHALTMLKQEDFRAWMSLVTPYLGDPGDPSVVAEHRQKANEGLFSARLFVDRHERALRLLAMFLENERLHVVWPKRMTTREETQVERMNDELFGLYKNFRYGDDISRNKAIEKAAEHCGYGRSRGYEIVDLREGKAS